MARGILEGGRHIGQPRLRPHRPPAGRIGPVHDLELRPEETEHLQRRQIGERLHRDARAPVQMQLRRQVDPLLGARQDQHPLGRGVQA